MPNILKMSPDYLIKGYGADDRIVYGIGMVAETSTLVSALSDIFARDNVDYIHVRSVRNNCYQLRVERDA